MLGILSIFGGSLSSLRRTIISMVVSHVLQFNGEIADTDEDRAVLLNSFFSCCFNTSGPLLGHVPEVNFTDDSIMCTPEEVFDLLCHIDCSKASGPDGISGKMLWGTAPSICHSLSQLFNLSICTATIPADWKVFNVVPVHKSGDRGMVTNYRPISLLSLVSKLLEKHIYSHMYIQISLVNHNGASENLTLLFHA